MEAVMPYLQIAGIVVGAILFIKLLSIPMKLIVKLILNGISGFVLLFIFNFIADFAGFSLEVNVLNCLIAGVLGIPGVIILIALKLFL